MALKATYDMDIIRYGCWRIQIYSVTAITVNHNRPSGNLGGSSDTTSANNRTENFFPAALLRHINGRLRVARTLSDAQASMTADTVSVDVVCKEWLKSGLVEGVNYTDYIRIWVEYEYDTRQIQYGPSEVVSGGLLEATFGGNTARRFTRRHRLTTAVLSALVCQAVLSMARFFFGTATSRTLE
ncbi:hypothetical protein B0H11DRAFT_1911950 [Mycena galericulata]|nr:hypothetical protein B0H11DRAFT_1911950 [Mycena galericulata]